VIFAGRGRERPAGGKAGAARSRPLVPDHRDPAGVLRPGKTSPSGVQAHQGHSFHFFKPAATDEGLNSKARDLLKTVGLSHRANTRAGDLSHGEKRVLELAIALAGEPKLLLLDEPMAGTGPEETKKLVEVLQSLKATIPMLLVEHDMDAVFQLADRISVLVYGGIIATGPPDEIRNDDKVREAYLGEDETA
jgi:branched-chain amino acid transport system ATP-binding protein